MRFNFAKSLPGECAFGKRGALRPRSVRGVEVPQTGERSPPRNAWHAFATSAVSFVCFFTGTLLAFTNLDHFWNSDLQTTRHHVRLDISLDHRPIGRILVIIEFELKSTESVHMWRAARHRRVTRRPCGRGEAAPPRRG